VQLARKSKPLCAALCNCGGTCMNEAACLGMALPLPQSLLPSFTSACCSFSTSLAVKHWPAASVKAQCGNVSSAWLAQPVDR